MIYNKIYYFLKLIHSTDILYRTGCGFIKLSLFDFLITSSFNFFEIVFFRVIFIKKIPESYPEYPILTIFFFFFILVGGQNGFLIYM